MVGFTASMTQGTTWTGLLSNNMPVIRKNVTDVLRRSRSMLPVYQQFGRVVTDDANLMDLDLYVENEDTGLTPISTGFETTTPTTTDAPHGIPLSDSYYLGSIQASQIEMNKAANPTSIVDIVAARYYKKLVAIEKDFDSDLIQGNQTANSLRITSLEQLVPPATHSGTTGTLTAPLWKFRQAANTVNNVTRTAWTSATAGGTGFEPLSVNGGKTAAGLTSGQERFALTSSNNPNDALLLLAHLDFLSSDGGDTTDVMLMSPTPYEDLQNSQEGRIRYNAVAGAAPENVDGKPKYPTYKGKICIGSSNFATSGLVANGSSSVSDVIWMLNMATLELKFPTGGFFTETDWKEVPMSPLAAYMAFFVAGQHKLVGRPDRNACYFKYGDTT